MFHRYNLTEWSTRYGLDEHPLHKILERFGYHWIAGGAVRAFLENRPITTDVDFFFNNPQEYEEFVSTHAIDPVKQRHVVTWKDTIDGVEYKIQAIKIGYYESMEECLDSFDYSICQFGIDRDVIVAGEFSLWDLARKRLVLNKITYGVATVRRMLKYAKQGFTVCSGCIAHILREVVDNPELIRSDVTYID